MKTRIREVAFSRHGLVIFEWFRPQNHLPLTQKSLTSRNLMKEENMAGLYGNRIRALAVSVLVLCAMTFGASATEILPLRGCKVRLLNLENPRLDAAVLVDGEPTTNALMDVVQALAFEVTFERPSDLRRLAALSIGWPDWAVPSVVEISVNGGPFQEYALKGERINPDNVGADYPVDILSLPPDAARTSLLSFRVKSVNTTGNRHGAFKLGLPLEAGLARLIPAGMYSDHMVLQRRKEVPVWGTSEAGAVVTVSFGGQCVKTRANAKGDWMVKLAPMEANATPQVLRIDDGKTAVEYQDVLVGEVWLCSGQSNMEMPLWQEGNPAFSNVGGDKFGPQDASPLLRLCGTWAEWSTCPREARRSRWTLFGDAMPRISALAYFFGQKLQQELDIPVGIILSCWGGTNIEAWTSASGYNSVPELADVAKIVNEKMPGTVEYRRKVTEAADVYASWLEKFRKAGAEGTALPDMPVMPDALQPWPSRDCPTVLYNVMIAKYVPFALRGAIWYQGESNVGNGPMYRHKLQALYNGWKKDFQLDEFPFYVVQLAPYGYPGGDPIHLPTCWEAQEDFCRDNEPSTGMVVINDVGDINDIHPHNKKPVGDRLANLALKRLYGFDTIPAEFPRLKECRMSGAKCVLSFANVTAWKTADGGPVRHFEAAGDDGVFVSAAAQIVGAQIHVTCPKLKKITAVRYMWNHGATASLFNEAGLPLGAFRTRE